MSFYSVIAGILFIESFKVLVFACCEGHGTSLPAATLAIMIITDVLITTDVFETEHKTVDYDVRIKLLDLLCFVVLAAMLVSINPYALQLFEAKAIARASVFGKPLIFWTWGTLYWLFVLVWNELLWNQIFKAAGHWPIAWRDRESRKLQIMTYNWFARFVFQSGVVVYASMTALCHFGGFKTFDQVPWIANFAMVIYAMLYLYTRVFHRRKRKGQERAKELAAASDSPTLSSPRPR
jgi:hypothetical protein